jgi:hypothetical protein
MYKTKRFAREAQIVIDRWEREDKHIPTQAEMDLVAEMISTLQGTGLATILKDIELPHNIAVCEVLEGLTLVFWEGDPIIKAFCDASLEELPEFLACEDDEIREFARVKLELLVNTDRQKDAASSS